MNRLIVASVTAAFVSANLHDRSHYEGKFFEWLQEFKVQPKDGTDFVHMLQNFANNEDLIQDTNSKNLSYTLGHNAYSHMSFDEFKTYMRLGLAAPSQEAPDFIHETPSDVSALPSSVDWSTKGAVTPVKNQGNCGSCWSFSATGALEGAYEIKYGTLESFSEQNLVSCDNLDSGCNGGLMNFAFTWTKNNKGLCTESGYPYTSGDTGKDGTCQQTSCSKNTMVAPASFTNVQTNDDNALMSALVQQPVSVAIQANQPAFQLYKSGVLTGTCGTRLDHGVLAVGYGTYTDGLDYYKVKNSWGVTWGMNGYVLLERGVSQPEGQCGILSGPPSYPNL